MAKRIRLDSTPTPPHDTQRPNAASKSLEEDNCSICLQQVVDRTVIPTCSHEFCFECLLVWSGSYLFHYVRNGGLISLLEQSRKCPLCSQSVGDHVIHHIRSTRDYQKHYLPPLRTSPRPVQSRSRPNPGARRAEREWGRRERQEREEADRLDRAITRRRWIYQHHLYAKVRPCQFLQPDGILLHPLAIACRIQLLHTVQTMSLSVPVFCLPGTTKPHDDVSAKRVACMGQSGR
jgi:hypothetical protein